MNVFKTMDGASGPLWKQSIKQEQTCTYMLTYAHSVLTLSGKMPKTLMTATEGESRTWG